METRLDPKVKAARIKKAIIFNLSIPFYLLAWLPDVLPAFIPHESVTLAITPCASYHDHHFTFMA